jgi:hypothetical protein
MTLLIVSSSPSSAFESSMALKAFGFRVYNSSIIIRLLRLATLLTSSVVIASSITAFSDGLDSVDVLYYISICLQVIIRFF